MRRNLPRYFLLSFLSFSFFTVVFHTMADAQVSANQSQLQNPLTTPPEQTIPTPTLYMQANAMQPIHENTTSLSPTPTIFIVPPQTTDVPVSPIPRQNTQQTHNKTEIPAISPTVTPTPTTTPTPQPTAQVGPVDLETLFSQYSTQYNVSEDELKKIAQCESGFNTNSDTGVYAGMFQFSATTWESERNAMGLDPNPDLRKDAVEAIHTASFMISRGGENAWPNCY